MPLIYPVIRDGQFKNRLLQKKMDKRIRQMGGYVKAFMDMLGGARPYVTERSCKNQFYSNLITPLPDFEAACRRADVPYTAFARPGMVHCYCMLPYFKEAREDFAKITDILKK